MPGPIWTPKGIPEAERDAADYVYLCLQDLVSRTEQFHSALRLLDFLESQSQRPKLFEWENEEHEFRLFSDWRTIAAREGAMSAYHFSKAMSGAGDVQLCPSIQSGINMDCKKRATKLFSQSFPKIDLLRDSIAHAADMFENESKVLRHAVKLANNKPRFAISNSLRDRIYESTVKGRLVSCEISDATYGKLSEVRDLFIAAYPRQFFRADSFTPKAAHKIGDAGPVL